LNLFILDACALLAVLAMEKGSDNIRNLFQKTVDHQAVYTGAALLKNDGIRKAYLGEGENSSVKTTQHPSGPKKRAFGGKSAGYGVKFREI
jgi:hypothetical protein